MTSSPKTVEHHAVNAQLHRQRLTDSPPAKADLADLKSRVDCRDIVREAWGQPKKPGALRDTYFSHWRPDGNKASFVVTHDGFKDFGGSGDSGDVFTFIQRELNYTLPQAIEWLQNRLGNQTASMPQRQRQERPAANEPPSNVWQNVAIGFIEAAQRELWQRPDILDYLRRERLLTDDTIRAAGLGYNPEARKVGGFWVEAGIVIPRYQDGTLWLLNIRTVTGSFADFLGIPEHTRRNGETIDKYLCMAGSKLIGSLYNADSFRPGRPILFVEGELDCMVAQQELGEAVSVVTLGGATNRISMVWKNRLLATDAPIYIALDSDNAGTDATRHLISELGEKATGLKYPAGYKDFTDFLNAGGDATLWFESQTNRRVFADGAPASWVSAMLTYMRPGAALIFVAMQQAARNGAIDPSSFKVPELLEWMHQNDYAVPKRTLYIHLKECEGELVQKCKALSFTSDGDKESTLQKCTKSDANRPAQHYCMIELSEIQKTVRRQVEKRLYDHEFKTDGKKGIKARPHIAGLIRLGIPNAAAITAKLDTVYQPIYQRQRWAYRYAEKRIQDKHTALIAELADLTPLKTDGYLIKKQSDLAACIVEARMPLGQPISLKQIAQWTGKHHTRVGQDLRKMGYEGHVSPTQVIPIKPRQNIKRAAVAAIPDGRWVGLMIDDNPEMQPFDQAAANRATKSVAMVIRPPNTYTFVGRPEPDELPTPAPKPVKIDVEQSSAAPPYKPTPYFGDDVNPEVDYNQVVLGLTMDDWEFERDTGFWYHPSSGQYCRTLIEAVQMQAGLSPDTSAGLNRIREVMFKSGWKLIYPNGDER